MIVLDSLHSLLDYECLLFHCDWLGSDLRIGHFFSFRCSLVNSHRWILNFWILLRLTTHECPLLYNSNSSCITPLLCVYPLLWNVPSNLLTSNGGPATADCITSGMWLPNRCLSLVIFVTIRKNQHASLQNTNNAHANVDRYRVRVPLGNREFAAINHNYHPTTA
jgi:hypothetical protein